MVSSSDPASSAGFSGTLHSIHGALSTKFSEFHSCHVGPLLNAANKLTGLHKKVTGRAANFYFHPLFSELAGRAIEKAARRLKPDVVICTAASSAVARAEIDAPIIYLSDATFAAMTELYPEWRALPEWNIRNGHETERLCLERAAAVVVSSDWARDSVERDYGVGASKTAVLPYGPNLSADLLPRSEPPTTSDPADELQLLYVGFNWQRKGGDFAVAVARRLNDMGCHTRLNMVGKVPETAAELPFVTWHGLIDKDTDDGAARLAELYRHAHIFMLPTIADATPIVFSEAASFAVPSVTFDVGGVSSAVRDGESGLVFPPDATPDEIALRLADLVKRDGALPALRRTSFAWSRNTANWEAWGDAVADLAVEAVATQPETIGARYEAPPAMHRVAPRELAFAPV